MFRGVMSGSTTRLNRQLFWFITSQTTGSQLKDAYETGRVGVELGTPGYKVRDLSTTF